MKRSLGRDDWLFAVRGTCQRQAPPWQLSSRWATARTSRSQLASARCARSRRRAKRAHRGDGRRVDLQGNVRGTQATEVAVHQAPFLRSRASRSARAARLNSRGYQVVEEAQELIKQYSSLGSRKSGSPRSCIVNVGAMASVQRSWLPESAGELLQASRALPCPHRVPGLSMQLLTLVDAGKVDWAW